MSRLSTGSATTGGDKKESDLSAIIAELRTALGGIPEVAKLYGKPEGAPSADDTFDLRGDMDEMKGAYGSPELELNEAEEQETTASETDEQPKGAYSDPFDPSTGLGSLRAEQPKNAYSKLEEKESAESESKDSENYIDDLKLPPKQPTPPIVQESEPKESESSDPSIYIDDLKDVKVAPAVQPGPLQPAPVVATDAAANYAKARKETDHRLARLAKFLPDKVREALDKKFEEATKLAQPKSDEDYKAATEALTKLQSSLDSKAPELRTTEADYLRKEIKRTLDSEGGTLEPAAKKGFVDQFAALDKKLPTGEGEAKTQLESLQKLSGDINGAILGRLKAISDLCVDYERLAPIVARALSIAGDKQADLEKANTEVKTGFAGQFVKDGLSITDIQAKLSRLENAAREAFKTFTVDDALEEQKNNLPASPDSLKPKGAALGRGAFGEVFELKNDGDKKLVGKSFQGDNLEAKKEMEHEAEIYARIGEHPNIAQCYGIHEVDGKSMLVMDKIEGQDMEKVFDDLNKRYRDKKLSREEYLAATQHMIKGTLMGLAQMEAMGLVHKDIKGDNVKFDTRTNQSVLIDMGLAQAEGKHENTKSFFPIAPPEQWAGRRGPDDHVVTSLWDSFTVGKILFEEMERDDDGIRQTLVTGGTPLRKEKVQDLFPHSSQFPKGAKDALQRDETNALKPQTDAKGQLVGQALKHSEGMKEDPNARNKDMEALKYDPDFLKKHGETLEKAVDAGEYRAMTQYVDFMNRLTHPDPSQRMSTADALKHPFLTDTMLSGEQLDKVFGKPTGSPPPEEKKDKPAKAPDASEGPRLNLDDLAEAYGKKSGGAQAPEDSLEEDESDEEKGPRIDTDELAAAYSGKQSSDDELDSLEEEADEKKSTKGKKKAKK